MSTELLPRYPLYISIVPDSDIDMRNNTEKICHGKYRFTAMDITPFGNPGVIKHHSDEYDHQSFN